MYANLKKTYTSVVLKTLKISFKATNSVVCLIIANNSNVFVGHRQRQPTTLLYMCC